jgi:Zn finger protein HypA/HybF involved in hydrogenase expression
MGKTLKLTKHHGPQECENCFRWVEFGKDNWVCPHCKHDNCPNFFNGNGRRERIKVELDEARALRALGLNLPE